MRRTWISSSGRILSGWGDATLNATVRAAQETVPGQVGHASWINTDDLQYAPFDDLAFGGHFGTQGQIDLGLRFADALSVPEPSMLILAITSLIGLLALRGGDGEPVGLRMIGMMARRLV